MFMEQSKLLDKNLTLKQRQWLQAYAQTGNATEAARIAGYKCRNDQSFRQIGYENLTKLDISELMEELGLSDANLLKVLRAGLVKPVKQLVKRMTRQTGFKQVVTEIEYIESPDYSIILKYLELALKLKGHIRDGKTNVGVDPP